MFLYNAYLMFNLLDSMAMFIENVLAYKGRTFKLFTTKRTKIFVLSKFLCINFNEFLYLSVSVKKNWCVRKYKVPNLSTSPSVYNYIRQKSSSIL